MKGKKYTSLLIALFFSIMQTFNSAAADLETRTKFGPGFFNNNNLPGITSDDVILDEHGYIIAVSDEALIREGISVESAGIFKIEETPIATEEEIPVVPPILNNRWGITLSDYDREMLAKITWLESNNQCDAGQQAVVEVVFNRVRSPLFPNTVMGVLSQRRQFTTWSFVNKGKPDARTYANIDAVLNGQTNILPYETLYFSTRPFKNKTVQTKIQDHYFCNQ